MAAGLIISLLVAVVSLYLWLWRTSKRRQLVDKIPGPPAMPLVGNAHMFKINGSDFFQQVMDISTEFATKSGIMRIWVGHQAVVALTHPETAEVILNSSKHMSKSREYNFLHPWLGTGLLTSTGEKWKGRRRLLTPTFHFKILQDFLQVFNEQAAIMAKKLGERVAKGSFDVFPYVTLCALDIICDTAMGHGVNAQANSESEYVKAVYSIGEVIQKRMKLPWLQWDAVFNMTAGGREHSRCLSILHGVSNKVIKERNDLLERELADRTGKVTMEDLTTDKPFVIGKQKRLAFLDMLLVAARGDPSITLTDIREEVDTFMFEGHDTTAAGITWAVYLIGAHPEIQKKVQQELDTVLGTEPRDLTANDLKSLKYLNCCIKETLRIYPSVPMFARVLDEDAQIGGFTVPKGTSCMILTPALHRNPKHFSDPERFDPTRWEVEKSGKRHPYCYVPFSAGLRNCIGQKFAMMEEKVLLANIFRRYNVTSLQRRDEIVANGELIMRPEHGITVTLTRRT